MIKSGTYPRLGQPAGRSAAHVRIALLTGVLALLAPALSLGEPTQLQLTYQKFEQAREANDFPAAEAYGRSALVAIESTPGTDPHELTDLLLRLGDVSDKAGDDQQALQLYRRALAMQESNLGPDHPDLVPLLSALANIQLKDRHYADAEVLLQRVLKIERAAYGARHENVLATLQQLRDVYRAAGDTDALARTEQQIKLFGATSRDLALAPGTAGAIAAKDRRYKLNQGYATVRVFYGTDRKTTGSPKPAEVYGAERGDLQYGYLDVTIPAAHREAELETRSRWDMVSYFVGEAGLRSRYVLLDSVTPQTREEFLSALRKQIKDAPSKDVFIFVHGFNSTFEDAARRCARNWPTIWTSTAHR